jgi:rhomboid protease GluP
MGWLVLLVLGGAAAYVMRPDERTRAARKALRPIEDLWFAIQDERARPDAFRDALRARTRWPIATWTIVVLNVLLFIAMGGGGDQDTLVRWGASVAPFTTGGEWWRLVTASFVHGGFIALFVDLAGFIQIALVLERLLGPLAIAAIFLSGSVLHTAIGLSQHPLVASAGASGGVLAVYGLLAAVLLRGIVRRSPFTIPLHVLRWFAPGAGLFLLHALWTGELATSAGLVPLAIGFAFGFVLARDVAEHPARITRIAAVAGATLAVAVGIAIPLRGITDVRPDIARIVADDDQAAHEYEGAVAQFKLGALKPDAIAQLIERKIEPGLYATQDHLRALTHAPQEQQPLVTAAGEYVGLRLESWTLRAMGFRKHNMHLLRDGDEKERAALAALEKLRTNCE